MKEKNKQRDLFQQTEGDAWFSRNSKILGSDRHIVEAYIEAINTFSIPPATYLEIGCGDAHKLSIIQNTFGGDAYGIDPSEIAIAAGKKHSADLNLTIGTADSLPYPDNYFDMVLYGCCLNLCDPELLFRISAECDRVLKNTGYILIMDFDPPFPYRNTYHHKKEFFTYKMDSPSMFLWHPCYSLIHKTPLTMRGKGVHENPNECMALSVVVKRPYDAYMITDPYK